MSTALLVDTGFSALPIFEELKKLGLQVHVVGSRPNDCLVSIADAYYQLDYSNLDSMRSLIESHQFDYLVPGCTDRSYQICSEFLDWGFQGLDNPTVTNIINDKKLFRDLLHELRISSPRSYTEIDYQKAKGLLIIKPVDAYSGRGISVTQASTGHGVHQAISYARSYSKSNKVIIEEFVAGQLFSYSCFISSGHIKYGFIVREDSNRNKFAVDTSALYHEFPEELENSIKSDIIKIFKKLNLENGLFHLQFIMDGENYWFIEATRRCPGDLYSILIQLSSGFNYASAYVRGYLGHGISEERAPTLERRIIRHTLAGSGRSNFSYWASNSSLKILRYYQVVECGRKWDPYAYNRCGIIFLEDDSPPEASSLYDDIAKGSEFYVA